MRDHPLRGDDVSARIPVRPRIAFTAGLTVLLVGLAASIETSEPAEAQDSIVSAEIPEAATEAIDQLWSPYCPGLMLAVCTSSGGAALRDSIVDQARAGLSSDSIVEFWVARFGEEYRAVPTFEGAGRIAWVTPFAALLVGLLAASVILAGRSRRRAREPAAPVTLEEEARLNEALAALDRDERPDF
jgi:cytochrome c-type biogenesis protein CcmH/NrfF